MTILHHVIVRVTRHIMVHNGRDRRYTCNQGPKFYYIITFQLFILKMKTSIYALILYTKLVTVTNFAYNIKVSVPILMFSGNNFM